MTPQMQRYNEPGETGDCHRTCIAMVLDMDRDQVPHFMEGVPANAALDSPEHIAAYQAERDWLWQHGVTPVHLGYNGADNSLDYVLHALSVSAHGSAIILGCTSGGVNHSVVVYNGEVFNPNGGTIDGPMQDGFWFVTVLARATDPLQRAA